MFKLKILISIFCVLLFLFPISGLIFASEEAVSVVLKAYELSGNNPSVINSCSAQFHVITKNNEDKSVTKKDIKVLMVGNNMYATKTDEYKCKRFMSVSEVIPGLGQWETTTIAMGSVNLDSYVAFESNNSLISRFRGSRDVRSIPEVQQFGRIPFLPGVLDFTVLQKINEQNYSFPVNFAKEIDEEMKKINVSCEIVGEVKYDGNATAKIIEIKNGECVCKYHIDILRGYLCPYMWYGDGSEYSWEYIASDYFQKKNTSLYYPKKFVRKRLQTTKEYQLLPDTLQFNQPIADSEFTIEVPEKAYVQDWVPRKSFIGLTKDEVNKLVEEEPRQLKIIQYRSTKKGKISFADESYKIENLDWLVKETFPETPVPIEIPRVQESFPLYRIISLSLGILILFIVFIIKKYTRRKT
jgi:hypothetical protein